MNRPIRLIALLAVFAFSFTLQAQALERCSFARHRPAYPPGSRNLKVGVPNGTAEKFSEPQKLFDYLKQIDGKICDVNWTEAKKDMDEWLKDPGGQMSKIEPELNDRIAKQGGASGPAASATVATATTSTASTASAPTVAPAAKACDAKLTAIKTRISSLKASPYNSAKVRAAEIDSILRSIDE